MEEKVTKVAEVSVMAPGEWLLAEIPSQLGCSAFHRIGVSLRVIIKASVDKSVFRIGVGNQLELPTCGG
jgi:hypothetical protein